MSIITILDELKQSEDFYLFLSSKAASYSLDKSFYLCGRADDKYRGDSFDEFDVFWQRNKAEYLAGYFAYDVAGEVEPRLKLAKNSFIQTNLINFTGFSKKIDFLFDAFQGWQDVLGNKTDVKIKDIRSNFSKDEYLKKVEQIKDYIKKGDIYQANLTRKFYGHFEEYIDDYKALALFSRLNEISPNPYNSFVKAGGVYILSASPELFLRVDVDGRVITAPIKGSSHPSKSRELALSEKDKSENLMITDLMRNDLSRVCKVGSVKVEELFGKNDYSTISHLHSEISGQLDISNNWQQNQLARVNLLKACLPAGSMTGTPKVRAIEICNDLEQMQRGIYSGAIGYIGNDEMQFSVIIRTLIIQGDKFEFQVGGAITYDSSPYKEYEETMIKAKPINDLLGVEKLVRGI